MVTKTQNNRRALLGEEMPALQGGHIAVRSDVRIGMSVEALEGFSSISSSLKAMIYAPKPD